MKVGLLGATGRVGGWVLEMCLERGHDVVALVRSPEKLKDEENFQVRKNQMSIIQGDATTVEGIQKLLDVKTLDVIISTLGSPNNETLVMKKSADALVTALTKHVDSEKKEENASKESENSTIPRIIWMTSTGINEATDQAKSYPLFGSTPSKWFFGYGLFGWLQYKLLIPYVIGQDLWDDMGFSEVVMRESPFQSKITLVRPGNMWPVSEHASFSKEWRTEGEVHGNLDYRWLDASDPPIGKWITRRAIATALLELVENSEYDGTAKSLFQ